MMSFITIMMESIDVKTLTMVLMAMMMMMMMMTISDDV